MISIEEKGRINWGKIRAEYIGGGISQRKLAEKHGISYASLRDRSISEGWVEKRTEAERKGVAKAEQKVANAVADNATIAADIKRSLLLRLKRIEEKYPVDATEVRSRSGNNIAIFRIRDLTAAFKDLTEDIPKGQAQDIEDLSPLVELLKNE